MYLFIALLAIAACFKIVEHKITRKAYRVGALIYVALPFIALGDVMWTSWGTWLDRTDAMLFIVFSLLTGIGMGVGYHRLLTHHSFETGPVIKGTLLILGAMGVVAKPIDFAANHLKHHAFSDREGDPHSPTEGLFHAHLGWILKPPVADRERYCKRLMQDRVIMFVDRFTLLWFFLGLGICYLVGGLSGFLWGGLIRVGYHNHVSFSVNSICHTFGDRPFDTKDESRNNWLIGLLAFGEGWHNNHHAFPAMAYHGMGWRQFDLNGLIIRGLVLLGLARNVKQPSPDLVERRRRQPVADPVIVN